MLAVLVVGTAFLPVPRTVIVLGAGAAFGLKAISIIIPSTTLGCILAFMCARRFFRQWVKGQLAKRRAWRIVAQAVDDEGSVIIALMRFWGPLPNFAQNYLFGLTNIGLLPYAVITFAFTLPQIGFYTFLGSSGRSMILDHGSTPLNLLLLALTIAIVLLLTLLVSRRIRTILARKAPAFEDMTDS